MSRPSCALLAASLILAAGPPAFAQPSAPTVLAGRWDFAQDGEGAPVCAVTLGSAPTIGGYQLALTKGCAAVFRQAGDIYAWYLSPQGELVFNDALRHGVLHFQQAAAGDWAATSGKMRYLFSRPAKPLTQAERMRGHWRLVALGGAPLCDFDMTSDPSGLAGTLTVRPGCRAPWSGRSVSAWSLKGRRITLADAAGKPVVTIADCGLGGCDGELPSGEFIGFTPVLE